MLSLMTGNIFSRDQYMKFHNTCIMKDSTLINYDSQVLFFYARMI